jgi:RNA polymerase sigma-70 factor (ECF subfamily)
MTAMVAGAPPEVPSRGEFPNARWDRHNELVDELSRLVAAAASGDRIALADVVSATQGDVWRLCAHLVDRASADDLTQETFLRALPAIARFRGESSLRTWLLQIARHTCADEIRRRRRGRALFDRLRGEQRPAVTSSGVVELDDLVARLDPDRRAAFVLTQVLGVSYAEAAEVCDCPVGTIRSRVARARADLVAAVRSADEQTGEPVPGALAPGDEGPDTGIAWSD